MSDPAPASLQAFLAGEGRALDLGAGTATPGRHARVGVALADRAALRAYAVPAGWPAGVPTGVPTGVLAKSIAVHLADARSALALVPRPEWPALKRLRSRRVPDGWLLVARFTSAVDVAAVLGELARQVVRRALEVVEPVEAVGRRPGPLLVLDERIWNPRGFGTADGPLVEVDDVHPGGRPNEGLVADLRPARGAVVSATTSPEVVAALAMAGVPLVGTAPDGVHESVRAAIGADVDLADPLAREEHSVLLRRAALDAHGRPRPQPSVSVVLATKRPDMLDHALRQVAKQRGVDRLELVLAPHGFTPDEAGLRRRVDAWPGDLAVTVLPQPADAVFGDVLTAAARAAAGDVVLKMDDDDWYGRDAVADLLRARAYSGADLVGMPAEQHYLAPVDTTVRRGHRSEAWVRFVAGGTMMIDATLLREVGHFRAVRRYVDAQLLHAVHAAGGASYRTHGLGYLLRRNASGHTWQASLDELLDPTRIEQQWDGFRPSRLLECDPEELPD